MAAHQAQPQCTIMTPATAPMKPAMDPTERSMWPAMMTITMPMARIRM